MNTTNQWHSLTAQECADQLDTDLSKGLSTKEASLRLQVYGPNQLKEKEKEPFWKEFLEELTEPLILLLVFTGILYTILGEISDGITIFVVILTLNTIEVLNEQRAKKAISALQELAEPGAYVIRDGEPVKVQAAEIVPGDILLLKAGNRIPADLRLVESYGLAIDESPLTGESAPVDKHPAAIRQTDCPLAERSSMAFSGTMVVRGRGRGLASGTGMDTEIGRVLGLARSVKPPRTPLQQAMDEVSRSLVWLALAFSIVIPLLGVLVAKQPLQSMLLTGLSLAFATIPEEMPIILTMVMSLGAFRLSKQSAIIKNLKAVETLGAITVIATDKTGTLTENRMSVQRVTPKYNLEDVYTAACLCNDIIGDGKKLAGDPLEKALIRAAEGFGLELESIYQAYQRLIEYSFDNNRKRMSVVCGDEKGYRVWVKGAPESILESAIAHHTEGGRQALDEGTLQVYLKEAASMAEAGLRVIAFAYKNMTEVPKDAEEAENDLIFLGLAGLLDPARPEAKTALLATRQAGIRSIMVTGDHPFTARAIARQVALADKECVLTGRELDALSDTELVQALKQTSIFARTTPEHKMRIVQCLQAQGERVAVTGDGINDAPALALADIGIAMGENGSDAAREAADMVLADDNYSTITNAIREGRALFANLKKGVRYYLAIKVALVSVMLLPVLLRIPLPFSPIQIIIMELFMDLAAAAAFVAEPAEDDLMSIPPRDPQARFMDKSMVSGIFSGALGLFAAVSAAYLITWGQGVEPVTAQTVAFCTWMLGHVFLAFNMRSERQPVTHVGLFSNRLMLGWGLAAAVFIVLSTYLPVLQVGMKTATLDGQHWLLIVGAAFLGTAWMEVWKVLSHTFSRK